MPSPAVPIETAMRTLITGLAAFAALDPMPTVRPYKIAQKDFKVGTGARAVAIHAPEQEHQNDLTGLGGGVSTPVLIECISEVFDDAWLVSETIRLNGTDPGTGLAGYGPATVASLAIQKISVDKTHKGFQSYEDGSDEGYYFCNLECTVDYGEAT